jgi:multiple sugar transport system ATP-binding protein
LTVYGNLAFALKIKRINKKLIEKKVREIAEMLGLADLLKRKPHQLSGGQKQRVAIGRAIIREPLVFLMDEPLSNLDANLKNSMRDEIKRLHNELKATFIYVTHDQIEAMTLATQLVVMNDGKIQQIGTPYEVFMNPTNIFVAKFTGVHSLNVIQCGLTVKSNEFSVSALGGILRGQFATTDIDIENAIIAIRPEGFEFSADGLGLKLRIVSFEILGVDTFVKCVVVEDTENNINVMLPTHLLKNGLQEIFVKPKPDMVMLFHSETGQCIQLQGHIEFAPRSNDSS